MQVFHIFRGAMNKEREQTKEHNIFFCVFLFSFFFFVLFLFVCVNAARPSRVIRAESASEPCGFVASIFFFFVLFFLRASPGHSALIHLRSDSIRGSSGRNGEVPRSGREWPSESKCKRKQVLFFIVDRFALCVDGAAGGLTPNTLLRR